MIHGSIFLLVKNKHTGRVENLRRNHNWFSKGKNYKDSKSKEEKKVKKEWDKNGGDFTLLKVEVY